MMSFEWIVFSFNEPIYMSTAKLAQRARKGQYIPSNDLVGPDLKVYQQKVYIYKADNDLAVAEYRD